MFEVHRGENPDVPRSGGLGESGGPGSGSYHDFLLGAKKGRQTEKDKGNPQGFSRMRQKRHRRILKK
jgi:hypothetical protein